MIKTLFSINFDNPGHFFACMGILDFSDRFFDNAYGYFIDGKFVLETNEEKPLTKIIDKLKSDEPNKLLNADNGESDSAVTFQDLDIRIDFWNHFDDRPKLKLFAGQSKAKKLIERWLYHLVQSPPDSCKQQNSKISINQWLERPDGDIRDMRDIQVMDVPSGFDARTAWNALDAGFSINEQKMDRQAYPLIEFFAYIGVQTYGWIEVGHAYKYHIWATPLPSIVSRAVAAGAITLPKTKCFEFKAEKSGQTKILKRAREVI